MSAIQRLAELGIMIHDRRGVKSFVAWERIVTIECLPKEEAP